MTKEGDHLMFDKIAHDFYNEVHKVKFTPYDDGPHLEWYYAESELYILYDRWTGMFKFVKARSPEEARKK